MNESHENGSAVRLLDTSNPIVGQQIRFGTTETSECIFHPIDGAGVGVVSCQFSVHSSQLVVSCQLVVS